jgi:hypothetical protein
MVMGQCGDHHIGDALRVHIRFGPAHGSAKRLDYARRDPIHAARPANRGLMEHHVKGNRNFPSSDN